MTRVEFDATIDDLADVNMRLAGRTATVRQQRVWTQIFLGVAFAMTALSSLMRLRDELTLSMIIVIVNVAVIGGALLVYGYRRFYLWHVRRSYRLLIKEMLEGAESLHCEFEIRPDALWCKTILSETSYPWPRFKLVEDREDGIEIWFNPGVAVIRNRAFSDVYERRSFIDAVRRAAAAKPA